MTAKRKVDGVVSPAFQLGLSGPTIYQGSTVPVDNNGSDGDLYVQIGSPYSMYSRVGGSWRLLQSAALSFTAETTYRGVPLNVSSGTDFVLVNRNPYTLDSIDTTLDSIAVTMDNNPGPWTDIILPEGPEGATVIVKDNNSLASMFNIYVEDQTADPIDGAVHIALTSNQADIELIFSGGFWHVIG